MRAVLQRVTKSSVLIDGKIHSSIKKGLLVLLCVEVGDTEEDSAYMEKKIPSLRIFPDADEKMNLSVCDIGGEILLVSQFTLAGDARRGTRPSYSDAARPEQAIPAYEDMLKRLNAYVPTRGGVFGANMQIELVNDGPVTIILDSRKRV